MSSGPVGLDCREYKYEHFHFTGDGTPQQLSTSNRWLVTKIQAYAPSGAGGQIGITDAPSGMITLAAGGCLVLEPNGGYRGTIDVQGNGMLVIVEFWYQPEQDGFPLTVEIIV